MRIDRIDIFVLKLQLKEPFEASYGRLQEKPAILLRATDHDGLQGFGEVPIFEAPLYTPDFLAGSLAVLEVHLAPRLIGKEIEGVEDLTRALDPIRGHHPAKAGIEAAYWHLCSQLGGVPLSKVWGNPARKAVEVGISLGSEPDMNRLLSKVDTAVATGYRRIKLKIKPGHDIDPVRAVRERFGDIALSVDGNGSYQSAESALWREMDSLGLVMIEQPFPAGKLLEHAALQQRMDTGVCLDESITSVDRVEDAIRLGSCRVVCVKPALVGGWKAAGQSATLARANGLQAWVGGMFETGIGKAFNLHLATAAEFSMPADISGTNRYFEQDVLADRIEAQQGSIAVPDVAGLGWEIDHDAIADLTTQAISVGETGRRRD